MLLIAADKFSNTVVGVNVDDGVCETAVKCSSVFHTLKFDLFNFIKKKVSSQMCMDAKIAIISPNSLKLLLLE